MGLMFTEKLEAWADEAPDDPVWLVGHRAWKARRVAQAACQLGKTLIHQGLKTGDRVALRLSGTACWPAAVAGIWKAGGVVVPLDPVAPDAANRVMALAGARLLVTAWPGRKAFRVTGSHAAHRRASVPWPVVDSEAPAALLGTSGTSGEPRLVTLTHANLLYSCGARASLAEHRPGDLVLSWLPLHHAYAFNADLLKSLISRVPVRRVASPGRIIRALRQARPTHLHAVPRLYEKIHRLAVGGQSLHRLTGGRLRWAGCGGAPLPSWLATWFAGRGLPLLEGYGLTEASPLISLNTPGQHRPGTAGRVVPGTEVRLADDGEILARGPGIMKGYWNDPECTNLAIADGWLRTGDLGRWEDGYLVVNGRKKEMVVLSTGRNVPPLPAEAAALALPWVDRAILCGNGLPQPALLVWRNGIGGTEAEVMRAMGAVDPRHRPAVVVFADRPLSAELGEITALGKPRRDRIGELWAPVLAERFQRAR